MPDAPSIRAYIALGANLGDRRGAIESALRRLRAAPGVHVTIVSPLLDNPAVGGPPDSPPFLNGVAEIETTLPALDLLQLLLGIERALGRERREKWGPRLIDLDLLLYGDQVIDHQSPGRPHLIVPHPLMHKRRFVLEPLAAIAPDVVHPVLRMPARDMLARVLG